MKNLLPKVLAGVIVIQAAAYYKFIYELAQEMHKSHKEVERIFDMLSPYVDWSNPELVQKLQEHNEAMEFIQHHKL